MSDPTFDDVLKEAYASAPLDDLPIDTLSFYYEGMVDDIGNPMEIYIYRGIKGDRQSEENVPLKDFRLEAGARFYGGQVVEFIAVPFDVVFPEVANQPVARGQLQIDGVSRFVATALRQAVGLGVSLEVTHRVFMESLVDDGPSQNPPIIFNLTNVVITGQRVVGDIVLPTRGNRKFHRGEVYSPTRFPSLVV